ncbi:hypothetical protein CLLI_05230 [Clostridium liquoris]|jgi:hypothetical protein|uniref:Uncharacterized protein n=1 Tax=Clostridium liquoris TaxID=1289519 RepID=A0A2T0B8C1_9CLOT|nr:hypothetical protein [Clostridium liquoris]PRR80139.1 hypothetical protein CLLI_05230 [Clostridium liquoris]
MDFVNKNFFKGLIPIAIIIILGYLFITILPVIIVGGLSIWGISYLIKKIKLWKSTAKWGAHKENIEVVNKEHDDFPQGEIIDVEFREVK